MATALPSPPSHSRHRHATVLHVLLHPTHSPRASAPPTLLGLSPLRPRLLYQTSSRLHRNLNEACGAIQAASSGPQKVGTAANPDGFDAVVESRDGKELKVGFHVSCSRTQLVYDDIFSNMHSGKTINAQIPKDILLHILGPQKVKSTAIKGIINTITAEYVQKEGLNVSKDLRVEESYEELEGSFQPGGSFYFRAVIQLKNT